MHQNSDETRALREKIFEYVLTRMDYDPIPLDYPNSEQELFAAAGLTLSEDGMGGDKALRLFEEVLAPATISTDHPGFVSFIPNAPTEAASIFDLVVSASSLYGGSWLEGAGAIFAENQVLTWFASEVGLPKGSGGSFVQGGTIGNLSALVTARAHFRSKRSDVTRWVIAASAELRIVISPRGGTPIRRCPRSRQSCWRRIPPAGRSLPAGY